MRNISTLERVEDIIGFEVFGELVRNNTFKRLEWIERNGEVANEV